jgi:hypothetical protein
MRPLCGPPARALTTTRARPDYARAMRWIAALLALILLPPAVPAATPIRVLLVGNSYADGTDNCCRASSTPPPGSRSR